jgi:PAS domain S-box-containing protein
VSTWSSIAIAARAIERVAAEVRGKAAARAGCEVRSRAEATVDVAQSQSYSDAIQSSGHAFFTVDLKGFITAWNRGAERLFGLPATDAVGGHVSLIVPESRRHEIVAILDSVRRDRTVEDFETVRIGHDGTLIDVALNVSPIKDASGVPFGCFAFAHNVTDQKLAEEQFRLAVEACPAGMIMTDRTGQIILANSEAERLFGYSRDELIGQSVDILVPADRRADHAQHRLGFAAKPETRRMAARRDLFAVRKDGVEFPVEVLLNPMQTRDGLVVLAVIIDVSESKRHEQLKDEFVATVSHELRTPLTSIAGSLGLLLGKAGGELPEPMARLLTIAHKNSQRLVRLINDVLDIEKIESGKMEFHLTRLEPGSLAEQAIESARGFASGYGVRIRLESTSRFSEVQADPDRLTQVITNLLSNAIKFSPPNDEIVVSVEQRDDTVRISVSDHGPGIPTAFRDRMFEKFAQADASDARQKGGTGLGLSIAKQIVVRLGGEIGFFDAEGGGTTFFVDLPKLDPEADAASDRSATTATQGRPLLLICDDDPAVAKSFALRLELDGFDSEIVSTGCAALERSASTKYAGILVDLTLPDCDGIALIQQLRAQPQTRDTPIMVVSGDLSRGRADCRAAGLDVLDWFQKPVNINRLAQALDRVAARASTRRPRVLHVDEDPGVLHIVAEALAPLAEIVSVGSAEAARRALVTDHFDLAVVDIAQTGKSGVDLLPDLRDRDGDAIPVIVFSPKDAAGTQPAPLNNSPAAIDGLVKMLRRRLRDARAPTKH